MSDSTYDVPWVSNLIKLVNIEAINTSSVRLRDSSIKASS
jgi:hypothetical protein